LGAIDLGMTMGNVTEPLILISKGVRAANSLRATIDKKGQALVEFTLCFILLLVVVWIPAEFGLAYYSGQVALNAAREGARIAAADPALTSGNCTMPCSSAPVGSALAATAARITNTAMLGPATVSVLYPVAAGGCNQQVRVAISGRYHFFFYQILRLMRINVPDYTDITRSVDMRWEHQAGCV